MIILKHNIAFYMYQKSVVKTIHFYIFLDGIQMVYILPELVQIHWVSMKRQYVYINLFHISYSPTYCNKMLFSEILKPE